MRQTKSLELKDFYALYKEDDLWMMKETHWEKDLQSIREAQFALGNGYLGTRGILEEIPFDSLPGTYIAGIYDRIGSQVAELVNFPNPFVFKLTIDGEKLDISIMKILHHERILNMKKGLLLRHTLYQDSKKRKYDYQSLRFVSMDKKNIGAMQIVFTPLDSNCEIEIQAGIDTAVWNVSALTEGRKKHFKIKDIDRHQNARCLVVETLEKKYIVIYWSGFYYETGNKKIFAKDDTIVLKLKKNQTVIFTKIFYIKHLPYSEYTPKVKEVLFKKFYRTFHANFQDILKKHIKIWNLLWKKAEVFIEGALHIQQNLRFNIYHMLICANTDNGFSSIGARTLTGEGYRGHVFWDAEIFLMPFYLFNFPEVAKNMLLYRYKRLDKAREIALKNGFKGAQFPWESADTGTEETPEWARDINGNIIKIYTHKMEHHITADIAYAVYKYYLVTADEEFMENYGYEMLFETARFWSHRLEFTRRKKYEIRHVIGPDEFHIDVNNDAYTNMMAKWNLLTAYDVFFKLKKKNPDLLNKLKRKLDLKEKEVRNWKKKASLIFINIKKNRLIEQFDGYLRLKKPDFIKRDENGIPILPPHLSTKDLGKTQLVKQADVIMLLYLLSDVFTTKTRKINYEFYIERTVHKSSLSAPICAIAACECGDLNRAYNLFNVALKADINNLYGNTRDGIHAASLGGVWQAVIFGFAGVSIKKEKLQINPRLPRAWRKIIFSLFWRGALIKFEVSNEIVRIRIESKKKEEKLEMKIFNRKYYLSPNKLYTFEKKKKSLVYYYY